MNGGDGFFLELALIAVLILLNAFFAAAEIAIVSARRGRLQVLAEEGNRRAQAALRLKADPDRFLATVQIGVTLVTTLASAVGGVAAIERLEPLLAALPASWARQVAEPAAVAIVVFAIAYLSLVVGELVPKSLAVRHAEAVALRMALPVERMSRIARPAVAVLTASSRVVLRLLGRKEERRPQFHTLEDLRAMAAEAEQQGVVKSDIVSGALEFHEREVREVLTPRPQITALALGAPLEETLALLSSSAHSRLPVYEGAVDNVVGFVYARDIYEAAVHGRPLDWAKLLRPALVIPGRKAATELLADMRKGGIQMAIVVDEHGGLLGLVTLEDLIEVIVGEIRDEQTPEGEPVTVLPGGVLEVEGTVPVHHLNESYGLMLPESSAYVTIAGLVLASLGVIPHAANVARVPPYTITVLDVAGRRIARVRIESTGEGGASRHHEPADSK